VYIIKLKINSKDQTYHLTIHIALIILSVLSFICFLFIAYKRPNYSTLGEKSLLELYDFYNTENVCVYCSALKPKLMRHCFICKRCVKVITMQNYDHHCKWLNNCIGEGNINYFYWFLIVFLIALLAIITDFIHIAIDPPSYLTELHENDMFIVLIVADLPVMLFIGYLCYKHTNLRMRIWRENRSGYNKAASEMPMMELNPDEDISQTVTTTNDIAPRLQHQSTGVYARIQEEPIS
jgi:hypothetical protein